ncbi:Glucan endo-1,3-beta-D-glucosidase [Bertholletia excelsa]
MHRRILHFLVVVQLGFLLCSGSSVTEEEAVRHRKELSHNKERQLRISTSQADITTPIPTIPLVNPTTPIVQTPVINPAVSNPDSPANTNPVMTPATATTPVSSSGSWCVASQSASQKALQMALDYACGYGGADCSAIQSGGSCFDPNTIRDHASYAFNSFYQKNPVPNSCNFAGTAMITNTDPSYGTCQYPFTSTSSTVLNTTNASGATVFGAGPITPTPTRSAATMPSPALFIPSPLVMVLILNHQFQLSTIN